MNGFEGMMIAEGAVVSGNVRCGKDCSIWYNATARGDSAELKMGSRVNIQESAVLHVDAGYPMNIGDDVTIGHGAIVHGAVIEDNCMIGMGSILMNGCHIGKNSLVAAGSLIPQNKKFPEGVLIVGSPAKVVRELTADEIIGNQKAAEHYVASAKAHFGKPAEKTAITKISGQDTAGGLKMDLKQLLEGCRTYRRFKQFEIPKEELEEIVSMAAKRSCGRNAQELRFVVVTNKEKIRTLCDHVKWAASLPSELGTPKEDEMPAAFVVIYYAGSASMIKDMDTGIAADTIAIAGYEKGYGSCILASINAKAYAEELGLGKDITMRLAIALGKPAHTSTIVEGKAGELSYYIDEERNYYVPKLPLNEVLSFDE